MATQVPDITQALGPAYNPSPADDGNAPALPKVFSAAKWIGLVNEVLALIPSASLPIYNQTGTPIQAGPIIINGYWTGLGYVANAAGAIGDTSIALITGTEPINIGSVFTFAGSSQSYTATSALTGAGSLSFTPALVSTVANGTALTINAGFTCALAAGVPATLFALSGVAAHSRGNSAGTGSFLSSINTSAQLVGNPVYLTASGGLAFAPSSASDVSQIVGRVATLANPGRIYGLIGLTINPQFSAQNVITSGELKVINAVGAEWLNVYSPSSSQQIVTGQSDSSGNGLLQLANASGQYKISLLSLAGGKIGVGANPDTNTALDVVSTTCAARLPCMTTTQKNAIPSPLAGFEVYDSTLNAKCVYNGTVWKTISTISPIMSRAAVTRVASQTILNATNTLVSFDTLEVDNASFSGTLPVTILTAPTTGWYLIKADVQWSLSAAGSSIDMDIYIAGAAIPGDGHLRTLSGAPLQTMSVTVMRQLTASQTISLNVQQVLGSSQTITVARLAVTRLSD